MNKIILLTIVLSLQSSLASAGKPIEVQGHRGARAVRPENTITAFKYAIDVGVDTLELDLGVTKDLELVVSHDQAINPNICLDAKGERIKDEVLIHSLTLAQVKTYDCGTLKNPRFPRQIPAPQERIPALKEVFELVNLHPNAKKIKFNIETKISKEKPDNTVTPEVFADLVYKSVQDSKMQNRITVQSFDFRTLELLRKKDPKIQIAMLYEDSSKNFLEEVDKMKANVFSPNWEFLTPKLVKEMRRTRAKIIPWTANDTDAWETLLRMNVDGIITDDPESLIQYLKEKKKR